ncbi:hypothetical protein [Hymenobacter fodinae]|uniref:Holliday junction resolvasome RuvABC endonuclease subunit n=1 Tax=Hymenobacter fodinae TaxID=2510796 RepID=A0A4Z0P7D9_9BACT|nr:hypothetical protein [Hymenobacter fodinae]TGE08273.1 hypothetical protein EU556_11160 [Hymenobacter fodinae]
MLKLRSKVVHVGIDPGVNVGFALSWAGELLQLQTLDFWSAIDELRLLAEGAQLHVYIENPNVNKPTFFKKGANSVAVRENISQKVGSNKRDAQLLIQFVERLGVKVLAMPPRKAGKITAAGFKQLTGWAQSSSQHARDAAMLVLGR